MSTTNSAEQFPSLIQHALTRVHPSWLPALVLGLNAMQESSPGYLDSLQEGAFLPDAGRLFAAFALPLTSVNYVLVGEGPYPRAESATGVCFMDGAVRELWSKDAQAGLSKKVNRATSLRNFIKMLLVADARLDASNTTLLAMAAVATTARLPSSDLIQDLAELQDNLGKQGFLLLNASLVFRPEVAPAKDALAWRVFLQAVFAALGQAQKNEQGKKILLVLWGKIAEQIKHIPASTQLASICSEHPYNLSFISNQVMQDFFAPMRLLIRQPSIESN
ncbi:uracil-DNA glycosylase [Undibacterium sp.]|uniref:uracil-DNA glycosylase n=1 Tax=Undibacterium sp. TaxID=1914977 RepID=UPI0025E8E3FD|nr:uracil-DNA glycosylase [Undibacterium sp.]